MASILKWYLYKTQKHVMIGSKKTTFFIFTTLLAFSVLQCSSAKKLEEQQPFKIGDVYYQDWVSGIEGGGSGSNIFISIQSNSNNIILESVYFQGKEARLELKNNTVFIGRFYGNANKPRDIVMSSNPLAEYGNKVPELSQKKMTFQLKDNECVVSYKIEGKLRYFKINNVLKKEVARYPSPPSRK